MSDEKPDYKVMLAELETLYNEWSKSGGGPQAMWMDGVWYFADGDEQ